MTSKHRTSWTAKLASLSSSSLQQLFLSSRAPDLLSRLHSSLSLSAERRGGNQRSDYRRGTRELQAGIIENQPLCRWEVLEGTGVEISIGKENVGFPVTTRTDFDCVSLISLEPYVHGRFALISGCKVMGMPDTPIGAVCSPESMAAR